MTNTTERRHRRRRNNGPLLMLSAAVLALATGPLSAVAQQQQAAAASTTTDLLFDTLDLDRDGVISRTDFDSSVGKIAAALGADFAGGVAGGALGGGENHSGGSIGDMQEGGDDELGLGRRAADSGTTDFNAADGVDLAGGADVAGGAAGGVNAAAAGDLSRNARAAHRDGLTGEVRPGKSFRPGSTSQKKPGWDKREPPKKLSFTKAFTASVAMILATEIGDKTFFIAAVLSMKNDRLAVFAGAILALIVMTILSTMMGLVLPSVLPRRYTHIIGGLLFLYFGVKLVLDSMSMEDKVSDELEEVEEELGVQGPGTNKKDEDDESAYASGTGTDTDLESANPNGNGITKRKGQSAASSASAPPARTTSGLSSATAYKSNSARQIFLQSLTLTFLAEWGDRSQIATIALAAAKDPLGVTVGGCVGHSMCTGMAVVGGRMLASRISEKTVSFWGGVIFNIFGIHSLFFEA